MCGNVLAANAVAEYYHLNHFGDGKGIEYILGDGDDESEKEAENIDDVVGWILRNAVP